MENNLRPPNTINDPFIKDQLAIQRTTLANERTFLAYIRTSLSFLVVGASFIKFFDHIVLEIFGWILLPLAVFISIKGISSFKKMKAKIKKEQQEVQTIIS